MTIEEAISHCEEVATERIECKDCVKEHQQLSGWLRELIAYKDTGMKPNDIMELKRTWKASCKCLGFNDKIEESEIVTQKECTKVNDRMDTILHKSCDMCMDKSNDWGEGSAHDFRVDGDGLFYFDSHFGWEGIKINFCPQCGRPLSEDVRVIGGNDEPTDDE